MDQLRESLISRYNWCLKNHESKRGDFHLFLNSQFFQELLRFREHHKKEDLKREYEDEKFRDRAANCEDILVQYCQYWSKRIEQMTSNKRFILPDLEKRDLTAKLILKLIEAIREDVLEQYSRVGKEATFVFLLKEKDRIKGRYRKNKENNNLFIFSQLPSRAISPEEMLIQKEREDIEGIVIQQAIKSASKPQKKWLSLFLKDETDNCFTSGKINLSSIANSAGKNRSSSSRAIKSLKDKIYRTTHTEYREVLR
ncbi:MAG: hypothetical protein ACPGJV_11630 [Bacteriovoracaceae bacterium]